MTGRLVERIVLGASALVLGGVGLGAVLTPTDFYESYDITVAGQVSLSSELRGAAATLVLSGVAVAAGAVWVRWAFSSGLVGAVVLLGYALGRTVSLVADGVPTSMIVAAGAVEATLGTAAASVAMRRRPRE